MKLKNILAIILTASVATMALADDGGGEGGGNGSKPQNSRTFKYFASDAVNGDFSKAGTVTLVAKTNVSVNSYLYITGSLSANWTVSGWGVGSDSELNTLKFYHTDNLSLQFSKFANPAKTSGTKTGAQSVTLQGQVQIYNDKTSALLFDSGLVAISELNSVFQPSGPNFGPKATGGVMRLGLTKKLTMANDVGPGTYQNIGLITITRN